MTEREKQKLRTFMKCAHEIASLSTCKRKSSGALLMTPDFGEVMAVGYNGPARGLPNDSCREEKPCGCAHAEMNCLVKARASTRQLLLLSTRAPCWNCACAIVNSWAVTKVVYARPSTAGVEGLELLARAGVQVLELP